MSGVHGRFAAVLTRIASATSVRRSRREDAERLELHGVEPAEMLHRLERTASRLEGVATRLERA
jgi:predicted nuclease with TOPRIM domain